MRPPKRKLKSRKAATRRSPRKAPARAKSASRKPQTKITKRIASVRPLPAQPEEILFRVEGKMSTFGGPHDLGMAANEDLPLFTKSDLQNPKYAYLFLPALLFKATALTEIFTLALHDALPTYKRLRTP